jgi:hypothetical protein
MRLLNADIIELKQQDRLAVPTATELRDILMFLGEAEPQTCAVALIASQIMRPCETTYLNWLNQGSLQSFWVDVDKNRITKMQHPSYKAKGMLTKTNKTKVSYRMLKKPMFSVWTSEQLLKYRAKYGDCQYGQVFPWKCANTLTKFFSRLRKQHGHELPCLLETTNEFLKGEDKTQFRISPYSFRRFAFTFHYWTTFNQDIVALSLFAGHTDVKTTWEYVYPKECIGLTQEMVDLKITFDQLVFGIDMRQLKLPQFVKQQELFASQLPIVDGQRNLLNYCMPETQPMRNIGSGRIN